MAILTHSGRAALAAAIANETLHLALGRGDPAWGEGAPPPEEASASALRAEVVRRSVDEVRFVEPHPEGEIALASGRFRVSPLPTAQLFIRTRFDFADAAGVVVREQALFVGAQVRSELPPGQRLFEAQHLLHPGTLLLIEHTPPIVRQASTRETFEFVLTF